MVDRTAPSTWVGHASAGLCATGFAALCLGFTDLVLALAVAFLVVALSRHVRRSTPIKPPVRSFVALAVWSFLGSALSKWPQQSLAWWAIGLVVCLAVWQIAAFPWSQAHSRFLGAAVACCGAAVGAFAVAEFAATSSEASGRMMHPNRLAAFVLLVWPVAYAWGRARASRLVKAGGLTASGLMLAALVVTFSRGGWIGAIAQAFYLFPRRRARVLVGVLVAVVIISAMLPWEMGGVARTILPSYRTNISRLSEWGAALSLLGDEPVWGVGVGNYSLAAPSNSLVPHNLFLHVASQTGLVGLCLFVALLADLWRGLVSRVSADRSFWAAAARMAIVGALAQGLVDY